MMVAEQSVRITNSHHVTVSFAWAEPTIELSAFNDVALEKKMIPTKLETRCSYTCQCGAVMPTFTGKLGGPIPNEIYEQMRAHAEEHTR
jgi:hypothetical protein